MNNVHIVVLLILMIAYWIYLLIKYEKDKKYNIEYIKENELMEKYNPLIAGCIQGNRDPLARDIMAVILNLIEKRCIKYEYLKIGEIYEHQVMKNKINEHKMDEIEKYIYDWFFENQSEKVNLFARLNIMPNSKFFKANMTRVKQLQKNFLDKIGANIESIPKSTRIFNTILALFCCVVSIVNIFDILLANNNEDEFIFTCIIIVTGLFIVGFFFSIFIELLKNIISKITNVISKFSEKKIVTTSIFGFIIFIISAIITCLVMEQKIIILNELLIAMSIILITTDNLMLKNSPKMIEDFSRLNSFKRKIEDETLLYEKNVQDIVIWGKYLAYAISFGVSQKVMEKLVTASEFKIESIEHFLDNLKNSRKKVIYFFEAIWEIPKVQIVVLILFLILYYFSKFSKMSW